MTAFEPLLELYPDALVRAGRVYPVVIAAEPPGRPRPLTVENRPASPSDLGAAGASHLARRRAEDPSLTNGPTVCWTGDDGDEVRVRVGEYFDMLATSDALRAEFVDRPDGTPVGALGLRARAHALAGDPLRSGIGRDAAIGVSVVLTVRRPGGERAFVIGRRGRVSSDRGCWHVAPSGMLELAGDLDPVAATVATELREELGLDLDPGDVLGRTARLGLIHDLLRLKPDLVVRLDLDVDPGDLQAVTEFDRLAFVPFDHEGLDAFWKTHAPHHLTPAAAGAIALLEGTLPVSRSAEPGHP